MKARGLVSRIGFGARLLSAAGIVSMAMFVGSSTFGTSVAAAAFPTRGCAQTVATPSATMFLSPCQITWYNRSVGLYFDAVEVGYPNTFCFFFYTGSTTFGHYCPPVDKKLNVTISSPDVPITRVREELLDTGADNYLWWSFSYYRP